MRGVNFPFAVLVRSYQLLVSSWWPRTCRFEPSCSQYALDALRAFPPPRALALIFRRLIRCHPWGKGGFDPLPDREK